MVQELTVGDQVLVLDGHVLELFTKGLNASIRIHLRHLSVHAAGPDRRGRMTHHFAPSDRPVNGFKIRVGAEDEPAVTAFVEVVRAEKARVLEDEAA